MKRKLLSFILSICMVVTLMPVSVFADGGGSTEPNDITNSGLELTSSDTTEITYNTVNPDNVEGTVTWKPTIKEQVGDDGGKHSTITGGTLTLNDAYTTGILDVDSVSGDIHVIVTGENTVGGIIHSSSYNLSITGDGSLKVDNGAYIQGGSSSTNAIETNNLTVNIDGAFTVNTTESDSAAFAMYDVNITASAITMDCKNKAVDSDGDVTLTATAKNGNIDITSKEDIAIECGKTVTISAKNGEVKLSSKNKSLYVNADIAINAYSVNIGSEDNCAIDCDGNVNISASTGDVVIDNVSNNSTNSNSLLEVTGDVSISASEGAVKLIAAKHNIDSKGNVTVRAKGNIAFSNTDNDGISIYLDDGEYGEIFKIEITSTDGEVILNSKETVFYVSNADSDVEINVSAPNGIIKIDSMSNYAISGSDKRGIKATAGKGVYSNSAYGWNIHDIEIISPVVEISSTNGSTIYADNVYIANSAKETKTAPELCDSVSIACSDDDAAIYSNGEIYANDLTVIGNTKAIEVKNTGTMALHGSGYVFGSIDDEEDDEIFEHDEKIVLIGNAENTGTFTDASAIGIDLSSLGNTTEPQYYTAGLGYAIYTPAAGSNPAKLLLHGINLKSADENSVLAVTLPSGNTTIECEKSSFIESITEASAASVKLNITGTAPLTVGSINFGSDADTLTIANDANLTATNYISVCSSGTVNGKVIVEGTLNASSEDGIAITSGQVEIGSTGVLNVTGEGGVKTGRTKVDNVYSSKDSFVIKDGGKFTGECINYNVMAFTDGTAITDSDASSIIVLPANYLPSGYSCKVVSGENGGETQYACTVAPADASPELSAESITGAGGELILTKQSATPPGGNDSGSHSGGGGSSSNTTSNTVTNDDGSKTTTVTDKTTGTVTETTKNTDGSTTVIETKKDGTVTQTDTDANGTKTITITDTAGNVVTTVTLPDSVSNADVKIPAKLGNDEGTVSVKVTYSDGKSETIKGSYSGGKVNIKVTGSASIEILDDFTPLAAAPLLPFTDVNADRWSYDNIYYVYNNELFKGLTDTTFGPTVSMNRGMLVTVLYRTENMLAGSEPEAAASAGFVDVAAGAYYEKAVNWAFAKGIVTGTDKTHFAPNDNVTREQLATILYRYASFKGYATDAAMGTAGFDDVSDISSFAADAMNWAVSAGILNGSDNKLMPKGNATREQVAAMMQRFCENVTK